MGYFIIIVFTTFLVSPPELLPIAFKRAKDCESYLTKQVKHNYKSMRKEKNKEYKYIINSTNDKFIICKKIKYPIFNNKQVNLF